MRSVIRPAAWWAVVCLAITGCGAAKPSRVVPPQLDPAAITAAVMQRADADRDGRLSGAELAAVPALTAAVAVLDTDADGAISAGELQSWLRAVRDSQVAITQVAALVTHRGKPLANATLRLIPEPFMGGGIQAAEAVTEAAGDAMPSIPGNEFDGVNCGLYRVEINGTGNDRRPLPARWNTESQLGLAVGGPLPEGGVVVFALD
jgi:hypothetical protein